MRRLKDFVKTADTAETGFGGDPRHRQAALVDKTDGDGQALCLRHCHRRDAEMAGEQPPYLAFSHPQPVAERRHRGRRIKAVERSLINKPERAAHAGGAALPRRAARCRIGATALAGAKAPACRLRRAGSEATIFQQRRPRRADRAAINAGGLHTGEEHPVKPMVARLQRGMAGCRVRQAHGAFVAAAGARVWRFSDVAGGKRQLSCGSRIAPSPSRRIPCAGRRG